MVGRGKVEKTKKKEVLGEGDLNNKRVKRC